jgi:hypothetical protein
MKTILLGLTLFLPTISAGWSQQDLEMASAITSMHQAQIRVSGALLTRELTPAQFTDGQLMLSQLAQSVSQSNAELCKNHQEYCR